MKLVRLVAFVALLIAVVAAPAHADGFFDGPTITCSTISIDPPASWINVTFDGNVNGKTFELVAPYGTSHPHLAIADFSKETSSSGVLVISAVAHSDFGEGPVTSNVVTATLTCHEPVPTSTSSTSTTSVAPSTTTTTVKAQTTTSTTIGSATTIAPPAPKKLPFTGSSSTPLALVAVVLLGTGGAGIMGSRRRKVGS